MVSVDCCFRSSTRCCRRWYTGAWCTLFLATCCSLLAAPSTSAVTAFTCSHHLMGSVPSDVSASLSAGRLDARHSKGSRLAGLSLPSSTRQRPLSPPTLDMIAGGGRGRGRGGRSSFDRRRDDRYRSVDEGSYSVRGEYNRGGEGRGGGGAGRGIGRVQGRGRVIGRSSGRGRQGYFTDGQGGQALDFEDDAFSRSGRSSNRRGKGRDRERGRRRGQQGFERGERTRGDELEGSGQRRARADDARRGGVWGYEDDDDDIVGVQPTRASALGAVRVESSSGADDEVDEGSLGSRMGPVDREHFYSIKSLPDIGASDIAVSALKSLGVVRPSKIQAISYSAILSGEHCVVADQTGSGKTLAYLAPLVQRLRLEELAEVHGRARPGRPRVLVLAPTAELAQQVHGVAQRLSGSVPFRSCCFTGGPGRIFKTQAKLLEEGVDVLVATPGRVATLLEAGVLNLEDCRAVILDEVDVLFMDETFLLAPIGTCAPEDTQFIFVTATLPQSVSDMLKEEFPGTKFLLGPGLHRVAPGVEEVLIDCSGPPDEPRNEETGMARKRDALLSQLERRMALRTLVFCNTIQGCRQVENILSRASRGGQFETLVYHSAIDPKQAASNMQQFMRSNALSPMVMVCTDRSSRGMDFDRAEVEHVLLYDFPRDPIEYMRRVGRTARAGRKGVVTVLAWGRQVPLVREIMAGNKRGKRLLRLDD